MVFQNPDNQLIGNIVEEDIAFGPENMGIPREEIEERITRALEATGMSAYREHSPNALSGGQKQRISIARVFLKNPAILILDEATSSIDTRTESIVQAGMDGLMYGRTVFVIAHRLSTIQNADVIMVLQLGHIIERGNHDQLIAEHGKYYQLYTGDFEEND